MVRFIISLAIFLFFASFATSTPLEKRDDALTGFKQCDGDFKNVVTSFGYTPNPVVTGQLVNVHIAGKATAVVEQGAVLTIVGYHNNKLDFLHVIDYCKLFVESSGFNCPTEKGDFDFKATWPIEKHPDVPKNTEKEFKLQITGT